MNLHRPHILITRPEGQHSGLSDGCRQLGLKVSHIPCLSIEPVAGLEWVRELEGNTDIVLFTSQNAVLHAHRKHALPWQGVQIHAIGLATAELLTSLGQPPSLKPVSPYSSESYLQQVENLCKQRLLIIKGVGGRSLIQEKLTAQGWRVNSADVYRRALPSVSTKLIDSTFNDNPPDIISVSSNETLLNLMTLLKPYKKHLLKIPLLVNSQRCSDLALSLGFTCKALVAEPAGDQGQLARLKQWLTMHC